MKGLLLLLSILSFCFANEVLKKGIEQGNGLGIEQGNGFKLESSDSSGLAKGKDLIIETLDKLQTENDINEIICHHLIFHNNL